MGTLRLLLALSVVATHSSSILWLPLPSGESAVRIFFVISGFYMALILNEKYLGVGYYHLFITNRFVRIYPIYFLMAGATLILTLFVPTEIQLFNPQRLSQFGPAAKALVFGSNLGIFGLDSFELMTLDHGSLHFTRSLDPLLTHLRLVTQAWTLSPELSFYVIAPFLVRRVPRLCALGVASILLRLYLIRDGYSSFAWTTQVFPSELVFFLTGSLLYHVYRSAWFQRRAAMLSPLAMIGAGLGLFTFGSLPIAVSYGLVIGSIPFLFETTKRNARDRWLGEMSYPVYMVHYFLVLAFRALLPPVTESAWFGDACAVVSIGMAALVYWSVGLPIDRWRDRRSTEALERTPQPASPVRIGKGTSTSGIRASD